MDQGGLDLWKKHQGSVFLVRPAGAELTNYYYYLIHLNIIFGQAFNTESVEFLLYIINVLTCGDLNSVQVQLAHTLLIAYEANSEQNLA